MAYAPKPDAFRQEVRHAAMCSGLSRAEIARRASVSENTVWGLMQMGKKTRWFALMRIARAVGREPREVRNGVFTLSPAAEPPAATP